MKQSRRRPQESARNRHGFSIFELLTVITVLLILFSMSVATIGDTSRSIDLNSASEIVSGALRLARQHATTHNRPVEARFYKFPDLITPNSEDAYRAVGLFLTPENENHLPEPLGNAQQLPGDIIIAEIQTYSSIIGLGRKGVQMRAPVVGMAPVPYSSITFLPNGSTTAGGPRDKLFLTLWSEYKALKDDYPPKDFVTIQVDSLTGGLQIYRP